MSANTNMPRISNTTPGVVDDRDQPDAVDVQHRDDDQRDQRDDQLRCVRLAAFSECQPSPFRAGISASGSVATTAVTVRMPANR